MFKWLSRKKYIVYGACLGHIICQSIIHFNEAPFLAANVIMAGIVMFIITCTDIVHSGHAD